MISNVQVSKEHRDAPNFEILCSNMDETDRNVLSKRSKSEHSFKHFPECNALLMQMLFSNSGAQSPTGRIAQVRIAYGNKCLNTNSFCSAALKLTHPKSHFDMQSFKNGYICSTFISCHTFTTFPLLQPWLLPEALLTKSLRIMDVSEAVHYNGFVMTVDAGIKLFSHTVCSVCKAEDGHGSSIIDPSALCKEPIGLSIPLCTLNPAESQSLTRFYESSNIPITLLTSRYQSLHEFLIEVNSFTSYLERSLLLCAASKLTKHEMIGFQILSCLALLYIDRIKLLMLLLKEKNSQAPMLALASSTIATSCIAVCSASPQQSYTMRTNITSLRIPLKIEELLKAQQSNGDELITDIISLIAFPSLNDKERIEESYVFQYDYVIPVRKPTTSMDIASQACTSAVQSLVCESNKSIGGTILRANPGDNQIKVHHSLSLVPVTTVTSCQDYFQRYFDILTTVSPQCLLSCVSLYPICHVFVATHDLVKRNSVIAIKQFKNLQLLSVSSNNVQVQISRFSDLGMFKQHHKDPRVEVVNANPPPSHHICRKSPPSRNNSKRSIHKRTSNKIRKCASFLKRCLHQSDYHYMYQKLLWSQLKGKKMNSFSLRKGLMLYCNTWSVSLHSSLKYHRAERHTTHSGDSLNAFMIHRAIEESRGFGRRVALFRGGKPSTQKSDPSDNDSDSGDGHAGAATSHEIPTSSHEASHSNGAMNLRPSSEAPPPLKMNSGVSQPGGEADRYVQSSQSPAALITKSSEQPLHSQGVSNNYIEPLQDKQVLFMPSAAANIGYQDSDNIMQPKLEVCMHPNIGVKQLI